MPLTTDSTEFKRDYSVASEDHKIRKRLELLNQRRGEYDSNTTIETLEQFIHEVEKSVRKTPPDIGKPYGPVARLECLHRMAESGVPTTAIVVWHTIAGYVNGKAQDGTCFPGIDTISRGSGQSPATVKRCVKLLVGIGALEKLRVGRGRGVSNKYRIVPEWRPSFGLVLNNGGDKLTGDPVCHGKKGLTGETKTKNNGSSHNEKQLNSDKITGHSRATNSLSNPGTNPGKIERASDATKSPGAGAPCDLVAPPGADSLLKAIRRGWLNLNDRQARHARKFLEQEQTEHAAPEVIAAGLERHLDWAEAWDRKPWDLASLLRTEKYHDRWETRPPNKKSTQKPESSKSHKSKAGNNRKVNSTKLKKTNATKTSKTAPKKKLTKKPTPKLTIESKSAVSEEISQQDSVQITQPPSTKTWSNSDLAALDMSGAVKAISQHINENKGCQSCMATMIKAQNNYPGKPMGVLAAQIDNDCHYDIKHREYRPCGVGRKLFRCLTDLHFGSGLPG